MSLSRSLSAMDRAGQFHPSATERANSYHEAQTFTIMSYQAIWTLLVEFRICACTRDKPWRESFLIWFTIHRTVSLSRQGPSITSGEMGGKEPLRPLVDTNQVRSCVRAWVRARVLAHASEHSRVHTCVMCTHDILFVCFSMCARCFILFGLESFQQTMACVKTRHKHSFRREP